MLPMLVKACPTFADKWEIHKQEYHDEENFLPYIALMEFNSHLIELYKTGITEEFPEIFTIVERLHTDGEHYVREAATIGLLEGIQNQLGNAGRDPEVFREYLLPVTAE